MSYEKAIRQKHAFQDSLEYFLKLIALMSNRELEITAARLADALSSEKQLKNPDSKRLAGQLVHYTLKMRANGEAKQKGFQRALFSMGREAYLSALAEREHQHDLRTYQARLDQYESKLNHHELNQASAKKRYLRQMAIWKAETTWWQRLLHDPPPFYYRSPPQRPIEPNLTNKKAEVVARFKGRHTYIEQAEGHVFPFIESQEWPSHTTVKTLMTKLLTSS